MARVGRVSDALVHRADDDRIAVLTLDSPANRNALSRRLVADLTGHLAEAGADESLHGVLLRSSHPVFCAGADLKEAATVDMVEAARTHHRPAARHRRPAGAGRLPARRPGARRRPGPGRLLRRRRLPRRRHLRPHRGAPRPGGRGDLHPAAGPAQPARGIRLVPHRPVGRCAARRASRGWSRTSSPADAMDAAVERVLDDLRAGARQGLVEAKRLLNADLVAAFDEHGDEMARLSGPAVPLRRRPGADGRGAAPLSPWRDPAHLERAASTRHPPRCARGRSARCSRMRNVRGRAPGARRLSVGEAARSRPPSLNARERQCRP